MRAIESVYKEFCKEPFILPSDEMLAQVEHRIGSILPKSFREYLLKYNGGMFSEPKIVSPGTLQSVGRLTFMKGVGVRPRTVCLATDHDLAIFDNNFPVKLLPIGHTLAGDLILLLLGGAQHGEIAIKHAFTDSYELLASDIEGFFESLRR